MISMQAGWRTSIAYFVLSIIAGLVMVSTESIWIDEGQTFLYVQQSSFGDWLHTLTQSTKSEAQMPFGMFVAWLGGKWIGTDEWSLRAVNLLWVGLAGVAVGLIGRELNKPVLLLVFLVHPFLWFYANEARPYAAQICAAAWLLYVLVRAHCHRSLSAGDVWVFGFASLIGYGSSLLFAFGVLGAAAGLGLLWKRDRLRPALGLRHWMAIATSVALLGILTAYYLYTLSRGASGAKIWSVTPLNLAFALYELLGFSGLGPPRNELRELTRTPHELGHHLLQIHFLLGLGFATLLHLAILTRLWKSRKEPLVQCLLVCILTSCFALYGAASVVHFPFWGRHMAALLPFIVLLVVAVTVLTGDNRSLVQRHWLIASLVLCLGASSLMLRFGADYRKDDYRSASRIALSALASGKVVWWSADPQECAAYYGVSTNSALSPGAKLVFCYQATEKDIAIWPAPDIILQSKPDIHDFHGQLRAYLERNPSYRTDRQFPAFKVWTK